MGVNWHWREDAWLAERLGLPALELCAPHEVIPPPALSAVARRAFVYARVPVLQVQNVAALTAQGFLLVDTAITLERQAHPCSAVKNTHFSVRHALSEDAEAVTTIARHAYHLTRFHQDPYIAKAVADDIQACWAANFFCGNRGDFLLVAHCGREIIGFLLALTPPSGSLVIDLIAVAPHGQGKGVGKALISAAEQHCQATTMRPGTTCVLTTRTGTQLANAASMAFYQRLGFVVCHAAHTLHRHPLP